MREKVEVTGGNKWQRRKRFGGGKWRRKETFQSSNRASSKEVEVRNAVLELLVLASRWRRCTRNRRSRGLQD
eukprot:761964-Hanusia_phi.AAC.1